MLTVQLSGAFRVALASGEDVTPASKLRCALLAVLAEAQDHTVSRARLQEMFWGLADAKKASGSLRSALFQLRRDFEGVGTDVISPHPNHVSLTDGFWSIERSDESDLFLEGMDLDIAGADGFEEWLREQRTKDPVQDRPEDSPARQAGFAAAFAPSPTSQFSLGVLPVQSRTQDPRAVAQANLGLEALLSHLGLLSPIAIFDLRGIAVRDGGLGAVSDNLPTLLLKPVVYRQDKELFLWLELIAPQASKPVASFRPFLLDPDTTSAAMLGVAEKVLDGFLTLPKDEIGADLVPWAVISSLFSLDADAVVSTEREVDRLLRVAPNPALQCAKVFIQIFKEHEGLAEAPSYEAPDLVAQLSHVPLNHPLRALCESLIGYSAHMLCADNDLSTAFLEQARMRAPHLALNLDHLAVLHLAQGNLAAARQAHLECSKLSGHSSWQYSYDVTGAMIALASGDYKSALRLSNASLIKKPRFVGALRYAMIGFAMTDSPDNARLMKKSILKLRPTYALDDWVDGFLTRSDPVFANNVSITLQRHRLI